MIFKLRDGLLKLYGIADDYASLHITERFAAASELTLKTNASTRTADFFECGGAVCVPYTAYAAGTAKRIFIIERVTDDGNGTLEVYARDALYLFARRAYRYRIRNTYKTGALLCLLASTATDVLPGALTVTGANIGELRWFDHDYDSLYRLMCRICDECGCGMFLGYNISTGAFCFECVPLTDRSASQSSLPHLILSRERENLANARFTCDTREYYNVAVVYGCENPEGGRYTVTVGGNVTEDRRELFIDAHEQLIDAYAVTEGTVVTYDVAKYLSKLTMLGENALNAHRATEIFTATLAANTDVPCGTRLSYVFGGVCREGVVAEKEIIHTGTVITRQLSIKQYI